MNQQETDQNLETEWFAIRTRREFQAAKELATLCDEIFFPTHKAVRNGAKTRESAVIPHVLFVRTNPERLLDLERQGREHPETSIPFWIYRQPGDTTIRPIPQKSIELLRLLTADDTTRCEIFTKKSIRLSRKRPSRSQLPKSLPPPPVSARIDQLSNRRDRLQYPHPKMSAILKPLCGTFQR